MVLTGALRGGPLTSQQVFLDEHRQQQQPQQPQPLAPRSDPDAQGRAAASIDLRCAGDPWSSDAYSTKLAVRNATDFDCAGQADRGFHEVAPGAKRIAVLLNETSPSHRAFWKGAQSACAALDLVALRGVANAPAQLDAAVAQIVHAQAQAVAVVADPMFVTEREKMSAHAATRLPVAYGLREHVVAGGLLSYASNLARNYQYAATYVDKILKGARPADLPVQQPTRFELVLNLKTAKTLGLNIPQPLLLRADEVIQ